jgi:large subunit ribosomal protein L18
MKRTKNYVLPHRRKREGKTDYRTRLRLLKSGKPRLVVRRSSKNITCQIIIYETMGDKVSVHSDSKELPKLGWKFLGGNIPSAYLTGFLCAKRAVDIGVKEAILDMGFYRSTPSNRIFSALKGAIDGGLNIPHSEEVLPKQERFSGAHIQAYAALLKKESREKYNRIFSGYIKLKINPEDITKAFEDTKKKILESKAAKKESKKEKKKVVKKTEKKAAKK